MKIKNEAIIELTNEEYEEAMKKQKEIEKMGFKIYPRGVTIYCCRSWVHLYEPAMVHIDAMKTPEYEIIDIKTLNDLQKVIPCRVVPGRDVNIENNELLIGVDYINETEDFILWLLIILKDKGYIVDFHKEIPNWLWRSDIDLKKVGWWVVAVEKREDKNNSGV